MLKITSIKIVSPNKIICTFSNSSIRIFDLLLVDFSSDMKNKILKDENILKAKIGVFGEIYWKDFGSLRDFDGKIIKCNYDFSPEFVFDNSKPI